MSKGDLLQLVNGEYVVVEAVQHEILEEPVTIYNFEVEDFHTYYVGEQSVLVHNDGCGPDKTINRSLGGDLRGTADFFTNIELRNGSYYVDKVTIDEIGRIEARGEDFSRLKKSKMSSRVDQPPRLRRGIFISFFAGI